MAEQLVERLTVGDSSPEAYKDEFQARREFD